jgi:hypothetical protein
MLQALMVSNHFHAAACAFETGAAQHVRGKA